MCQMFFVVEGFNLVHFIYNKIVSPPLIYTHRAASKFFPSRIYNFTLYLKILYILIITKQHQCVKTWTYCLLVLCVFSHQGLRQDKWILFIHIYIITKNMKKRMEKKLKLLRNHSSSFLNCFIWYILGQKYYIGKLCCCFFFLFVVYLLFVSDCLCFFSWMKISP